MRVYGMPDSAKTAEFTMFMQLTGFDLAPRDPAWRADVSYTRTPEGAKLTIADTRRIIHLR
jgi:hypothetical protein